MKYKFGRNSLDYLKKYQERPSSAYRKIKEIYFEFRTNLYHTDYTDVEFNVDTMLFKVNTMKTICILRT